MDTVKKLVRVTAEDLEEGEPRDNKACPINRAVSRLLSPPWRSQVGNYHVSFYHDRSLGHVPDFAAESETAKKKVRAIDLGWPVQPFGFYLDIPKEALK